MKKVLCIMAAVLCILIVSCSKDSAMPVAATDYSAKDIADDTSANPGSTNPKGNPQYGSITGFILPYNAKTNFILYSSKFVSAPYYTDYEGQFRLDSLPPGIYSMAIDCGFENGDTVLTNIFIKEKLITNIGTIILHE